MYWLVTWTTYGSWLPGDPRGFRTFRGREYVPPPKRYAKPGEQMYVPSEYADRYEEAKEAVPVGVRLTAEEIEIVTSAIVAEIDAVGLKPLILSVEGQHVHLIAEFGPLLIRPTVGRLKAAATRALPNPGDRKRVWAKECHMRSLPDDAAVKNGSNYVRRHEDHGAQIHDWTTPSRPLGGR